MVDHTLHRTSHIYGGSSQRFSDRLLLTDSSLIFINRNKLAGFNFIHGLRLYNVSETISNSNFMDCLDRCQANELTCISFSYSKQKLECQLYDHDRFDEDDNFPINENESTRSDWLHYRFNQINQLQSLILQNNIIAK